MRKIIIFFVMVTSLFSIAETQEMQEGSDEKTGQRSFAVYYGKPYYYAPYYYYYPNRPYYTHYYRYPYRPYYFHYGWQR